MLKSYSALSFLSMFSLYSVLRDDVNNRFGAGGVGAGFGSGVGGGRGSGLGVGGRGGANITFDTFLLFGFIAMHDSKGVSAYACRQYLFASENDVSYRSVRYKLAMLARLGYIVNLGRSTKSVWKLTDLATGLVIKSIGRDALRESALLVKSSSE